MRRALSIADLVRLLEARTRALECARDERASFARLRFGELVAVNIALGAGRFAAAPGWIERLELEHVQQYLRADDAWDRGERALVAEPWRAIFSAERARHDARRSLEAAAVVHLMYDLPIALVRVGTESARAFEDLTGLYASGEGLRIVGARNPRGWRSLVGRAFEGEGRRTATVNGHRVSEGVCDVGRWAHQTANSSPGRVFDKQQTAIRPRDPTRRNGASWQRELREQAWDDALAMIEGDEEARRAAFVRIELAAMCEVRRIVGDA